MKYGNTDKADNYYSSRFLRCCCNYKDKNKTAMCNLSDTVSLVVTTAECALAVNGIPSCSNSNITND